MPQKITAEISAEQFKENFGFEEFVEEGFFFFQKTKMKKEMCLKKICFKKMVEDVFNQKIEEHFTNKLRKVFEGNV